MANKLKNIIILSSIVSTITVLSACKSVTLPSYSPPQAGPTASLKLPAMSNSRMIILPSSNHGVTIKHLVNNQCIKQSTLDKELVRKGGEVVIPANTQFTINLTSTQDGFICNATKVFSPTAQGQYEITFNTLYKKCSFSLYQNFTATERTPVESEQSRQTNLPNCS